MIALYLEKGLVVQKKGYRFGEPLKPKVASNKKANIENHILPILGKKTLSSLSSSDVERLYAKVASGTTAQDRKTGFRARRIVKGGEGAARKVVRDFSAICTFGVQNGLLQTNPMNRARVHTTDKMRKDFVRQKDVADFLALIDVHEEETGNRMAADIVRLWLHTGCRHEEISALEWEFIDLAEERIEYPDTKTGESVRVLSRSAVEILKRQPRGTSLYVFPATRGYGHYTAARDFLKRIRQDPRFAKISPHALRHTHGSLAVAAGVGLPIVKRMMGHTRIQSTERYVHIEEVSAKAGSNALADFLGTQ